jgi:hypothetical protein
MTRPGATTRTIRAMASAIPLRCVPRINMLSPELQGETIPAACYLAGGGAVTVMP